ncbi:MAG: oligosaccharide flippase family protein, partial [Pseudonocardiaceae bacterium]
MSARPETRTASRLGGYVLSLGTAEVIGRGLSFVAIIVVARVLGPESFGKFALAQVVVLYLSALGDGGLTLWTQREIVRRPHDLSRLIAQTLVAQIVLAVAAMSALAV